MTKQIQVKKRDHSLEDFDEGKIARVVTAAGLEPDQGRQLAATVGKWVRRSRKSTLTSLEIRDKVLEELRRVNKYAANLFAWYEKTKEKSSSER